MKEKDVRQARRLRSPFVLEFHEDAILKVLCLQKSLPVDRAIEESWETQVPHQVSAVLTSEEVLVEVLRKVHKNRLEKVKTGDIVLSGALVIEFLDGPVEESQILVVGINQFEKDPRVLLLEQ